MQNGSELDINLDEFVTDYKPLAPGSIFNDPDFMEEIAGILDAKGNNFSSFDEYSEIRTVIDEKGNEQILMNVND